MARHQPHPRGPPIRRSPPDEAQVPQAVAAGRHPEAQTRWQGRTSDGSSLRGRRTGAGQQEQQEVQGLHRDPQQGDQIMTPADAAAILTILRKYIRAVETKLYWDMSTSEARKEIAETERLAAVVEALTETSQ